MDEEYDLPDAPDEPDGQGQVDSAPPEAPQAAPPQDSLESLSNEQLAAIAGVSLKPPADDLGGKSNEELAKIAGVQLAEPHQVAQRNDARSIADEIFDAKYKTRSGATMMPSLPRNNMYGGLFTDPNADLRPPEPNINSVDRFINQHVSLGDLKDEFLQKHGKPFEETEFRREVLRRIQERATGLSDQSGQYGKNDHATQYIQDRLPLAGAVYSTSAQQAIAAQKRIADGTSTQQDFNEVAQFKRLQDAEIEQGVAAKFLDKLSHAPGMLLELQSLGLLPSTVIGGGGRFARNVASGESTGEAGKQFGQEALTNTAFGLVGGAPGLTGGSGLRGFALGTGKAYGAMEGAKEVGAGLGFNKEGGLPSGIRNALVYGDTKVLMDSLLDLGFVATLEGSVKAIKAVQGGENPNVAIQDLIGPQQLEKLRADAQRRDDLRGNQSGRNAATPTVNYEGLRSSLRNINDSLVNGRMQDTYDGPPGPATYGDRATSPDSIRWKEQLQAEDNAKRTAQDQAGADLVKQTFGDVPRPTVPTDEAANSAANLATESTPIPEKTAANSANSEVMPSAERRTSEFDDTFTAAGLTDKQKDAMLGRLGQRTQADLADETGTTKQNIQKHEAAAIAKLAKHLGIDPDKIQSVEQAYKALKDEAAADAKAVRERIDVVDPTGTISRKRAQESRRAAQLEAAHDQLVDDFFRAATEQHVTPEELSVITKLGEENARRQIASESLEGAGREAGLRPTETPATGELPGAVEPENLRPAFVEKAKAAADAARDRLKSKFGLKSGVDPTDIPDLAIYYAGRIVEKGYDFAMFAKDAVAQVGEAIKPHLQAIWDQAQSQLKPGTIIPKGEPKRSGLRDAIVRAFAPASRGESAKVASGIFREKLADMARGRELATASLKDAAKFMDAELAKAGKDQAARDQVFLKMTDAIEGGDIASLPDGYREVAQSLRDMIDERTKAVVDRGIVNDTIENYLGHLWAKPGMDAEQIGRSLSSRRPLAGKEGFKKQRTIPTYREGIEQGLRPIDDNPVRLVLKTIEAVDKSVMAHDVRSELKEQGLRKFIKLGGESPEGWVRGTDPKDTVMTPPENDGGPVLRGHYFYPEPVARLLSNYAGPGLVGNPIYDVFRGFGNALNQFQLGLGFFHAGFVAMETPITGLEIGLRKLARGDLSGISEAAKAVVPGYSPYRYFTEGSKVLKEYYAPGSQGAEYGQIVKQLTEAGGRAKMDAMYGGQADKLRESFKNASALGRTKSMAQAFLAIPELLSKPVMEGLVPRIKMGTFSDMARLEIEKLGPNADPNARRAALGKAWDSVENRFGQLTYDNVFWNRVGKDMAMASIRSVGWNVGTLREIGGGIKDIGLLRRGEASPRLAYLVAMPAVAALYGSIFQYIMTGQGPQDLKDAFFPRTGGKRKDGSDDRMSLPSYMRDVQHLTNRAFDDPMQVPSNIYEMAKGKLNPSISLLAEMLSNRDYFDKEIRNPDHPYTQQAMELAGHLAGGFEPFTTRTFRKESAKGRGWDALALGIVGVTPAPNRVTQSNAQQRAIEKRYHGMRK